MKRTAAIVIFLMSIIILAAGPSAAQEDIINEEISEKQPITIGVVFFTKSMSRPGYQAYYTHMGFDGEYIKVKYELYYHYDELEEREFFTLAVDPTDHALLSVKPFPGEDPEKVTRLTIKVADKLGRLTVDEYKGP